MTEQSNANAPSAPQSSTPVQAQEANAAQPSAAPSPKKPRRALYRAGRVSVSPAARETASPDE